MQQTNLEFPYPRTGLRRRKAIRRDLDELMAKIRKAAGIGLHLGCGGDYIPGMINCDAYCDKADRSLDATDLSDFTNQSVDLVENHHMIEHLSFEQAEKGLAEWARVLKPGGLLVITCPDLDLIMRKWVRGSNDKKRKMLPMLYGSQENEGLFHRSGYTRELMAEQLRRHGFKVEFSYAPYPSRSTPSMIVFARKE